MYFLFSTLHNLNYVPISNQWQDKNTLPVIYRFTDILRKTWQNGFVEVEVARDLSAKYALKYIQKDYNHKTKQLKSIRMGKTEIDKQADWLKSNPDVTKFTILTKDNQYIDIPVYGYIADMVYPSVNRSVPKELRDCFRRVSNFINLKLQDNPDYIFKAELEYYKNKYEQEFRLFGVENICTSVGSDNYGYFRFDEDIDYIKTHIIDVEKIYELNYARELHNEFVLMHNFRTYDIPFEVSKLNVKISKLLNVEKDAE